MANCPKCGRHLKLTDISQFCPECGVNLCMYGFEERFYREAKTAELSQAGISCKIRRFRSAYIGSKLTVARMCTVFLPLGAACIPTGRAILSLPMLTKEFTFSLVGLINLFMNGDFAFLSSMAAVPAEQSAFNALLRVIYALCAVVFFSLMIFLFTLFSFTSIKNTQKMLTVTAGLGILASIACFVLIGTFASACKGSVLLSGGSGFGSAVSVLAFGANFVINLLIWKRGIPVTYIEGNPERAEIWKKVKAGEIGIDDLPYPVVETEETRKIKEEIIAEKQAYLQNVAEYGGKDGDNDE